MSVSECVRGDAAAVGTRDEVHKVRQVIPGPFGGRSDAQIPQGPEESVVVRLEGVGTQHPFRCRWDLFLWSLVPGCHIRWVLDLSM